MIIFGFYAVYRGFLSRERAKRRIATEIIRVLKEDEELAVKYKVLQLTQPCGTVAAATRCPDEEQGPDAPAGPLADGAGDVIEEGLMASLRIQVEIYEARAARRRWRIMCGLAAVLASASERIRGRTREADLSERFSSLSLDELMMVQLRLSRRNEQQERLDTLRFQRTQSPVSVVVENP